MKRDWIMICHRGRVLLDIQQAIGEWRKEKGFDTGRSNIPEKLMLVVTELSEAMEAYRDGAFTTSIVKRKPEGLPSELADVFIRLCDLAGALGIDLGDEVARKMIYNETRPYKHGKGC